MKKLALATVALAASLPMAAQADLLFTVGGKASLWHAKPTGQLDSNFSVEKDGLNLGSDNGTQLTVFVEHPLPIIPNVKIKQTLLEVDGKGNITGTFAKQEFTSVTSTTLDLSHTDLTLYWGLPLPLPFVDINFGLTGRNFTGEAEVVGTIKDGGTSHKEDLDLTLPMAYGEVKIDTPFGVYAYADVNWISYNKNKIMDTSIAAGYNLPIPLVDVGLEVGYRVFALETDKKDVHFSADTDIKGVFAGVSVSVGF